MRRGPVHDQAVDDHLSIEEVMDFLSGLGEADFLRLERLAQARIVSVREVEWEDLLNTAFERVISGSRKWPRGLTYDRFFSQVMRSIADEHYKHQKRVTKAGVILESDLRRSDNSSQVDDIKFAFPDNPGPEAFLEAKETLAEIENIFEEDEHAFAVILARKEGLSPQEAQEEFEMTATEYNTAIRKVRRAFLKRGLVGQRS